MSKNQRGFLLRLAVSVVGIGLVVLTVNIQDATNSLLSINPAGLVLAMIMFQLGLVVRAGRWGVLLRPHTDALPLWQLVRLYYIGMFFNLFLPTGFGGDVVRAAELGTEVDRATAAATVLLDRMLGIMALFAVALAAAPLAVGVVPPNVLWLTIGIALAGCLAGGLVLQGGAFTIVLNGAEHLLGRLPVVPKLIAALRRFNDAIALVGHDRSVLAGAFGVSLVFNLLLIGLHIVLSQALTLGVPAAAYIVIVPLTSIMLLVPSIAGIGVREYSLVALVALFGANAEGGAALGFAVLLQSIISGIIGWAWYVRYSLQKRETADPS